MNLLDKNTRFALPIVCPATGEHVSAETLYNRCCVKFGLTVRDHIGDLVFDNLDYEADASVCATDAGNEALHDAIYAWAASVREQLAAAGRTETPQAAGGRSAWGRDDNYPWRVIVRGELPSGQWVTLEIYEWSTEHGAHLMGAESAMDYTTGYLATHYYIGEVA